MKLEGFAEIRANQDRRENQITFDFLKFQLMFLSPMPIHSLSKEVTKGSFIL